MYNFSLKDNENILFEAMNVVAEFSEKKKEIAIVITNKRLIFFEDANKNSYIDVLNITRKGYALANLEPVLEVDKEKIEEIKYIDGGTELIINEEIIFIFDLNLLKILSDKIK